MEASTHLFFFNQVYSVREVLFKNKKDCVLVYNFPAVHVPYIRTSACTFNVLNNTLISEKLFQFKFVGQCNNYCIIVWTVCQAE